MIRILQENGSTASHLMSVLVRNRSARVGGAVILFFVAVSILNLAYPEYMGVTNAFSIRSFTNFSANLDAVPTPPTFSEGWEYIFGTTAYAIPILPAILASITVDLAFAVPIAGISALMGTIAGVLCTYLSRKMEMGMLAVAGIVSSFPLIISVMIFGMMLSFTISGIVVGIVFVMWSYYALIARNMTLDIRNRQYIEASRAAGASKFRVIFRHVIPNAISPIMARFSLDLATVIVILSAIDYIFYSQFIGLAPYPEMGSLIAAFQGAGALYGPHNPLSGPYIPVNSALLLFQGDWWIVVIPIIFLVILVLSLISFSTGLRETLDPRVRF